MDCGEEVAILKKEIGPLVGGESNLAFDLLQNKMTVSGGQADPEAISRAVAQTGMRAVPWDGSCPAGACPVEEGLWQRHGRVFLCASSGVFLAAGFVLDAWGSGGILAAWKGAAGHPAETLWIQGLPYAASVISGAWFILPKAFYALRKLRPDMNLLMVIAVAGAAILGEWLEAASVSFLFSLALLLESWSVGRARSSIRSLMELSTPVARVRCPVDGDIEEKPVEQVPVGATVLVPPGEKIPLDGILLKGSTSVNQAPITGESMPVFKKPGDEVYAGTINGEGAIEFRSTRPSSDTALARIIHLVEEAQGRRARTEQWVERFARYYTPAMMALAGLVALGPPLLTGLPWSPWFYQALVLLVIACPCSLVISTPVSIVAGLTTAARHGLLIKGGVYLEVPAGIQVVAFDKTGTLTRGKPRVRDVIPMDDHTVGGLLSYAAALESHSTHPLARAIVSEAQEKNLSVPRAEEFTLLPGQGAQGRIGDRTYWVGSHRLLDQWDKDNPAFHSMATRLEDSGHSLVVMWCDDHICGLVSVADGVRPEARQAVRSLKELGVRRVVMITGDNQRTAESIAAVTEVDEAHAELLPEDKVRVVRELKERYGQVAMVGDGVNDAPAMAEASLAIAMGTMGSDTAIETADIALMSDDLSRLPWLVKHSRRTLGVIRQNIFLSLAVKGLFVGMAVGGLGTLWGAIAADMGVSLLVIFNGLRLLGPPLSKRTG